MIIIIFFKYCILEYCIFLAFKKSVCVCVCKYMHKLDKSVAYIYLMMIIQYFSEVTNIYTSCSLFLHTQNWVLQDDDGLPLVNTTKVQKQQNLVLCYCMSLKQIPPPPKKK